MIIDLRSDTVTKPTPEMLEFMFKANVGDDVFNEDPSVNQLQSLAAEMFGMEAAIFCPSGTMTNQIAVKAHTQPGDELICETGAHLYYYEGGGIAANSGVTTRTLTGNRGVFTADQLSDVLRPSDVHFPKPSLVSIENTCNRGGGKIFDFNEIQKIKVVCENEGLKLHLDGARLFNALMAENRAPKEIGNTFDSVSICLSKGLGAPVGSLLLGSQKLIEQAYRIRKVFGGGMRQAGYLASAGIFALENNVNRLSESHRLAKDIESVLENCEYVSGVLEVETNIIVFELKKHISTDEFLDYLKENEILAFAVGNQNIRFVTHLSVPTQALDQIKKVLEGYSA
ncbi:MAG: threonine aldolase family protein [Flavobacteriales bacterium]